MARWLVMCACMFGVVSVGYREVSRAPDARPLGGVCESTHECRKGTRCFDVQGVMEGQCSAPCNSNALCNNTFGAAALCLGADLCARTCRFSSDCPEGTTCNAYSWCERGEPE
ncbi:MAG: hypothetical protein RL701_3134 [Pseudomonadota bacterium]